MPLPSWYVPSRLPSDDGLHTDKLNPDLRILDHGYTVSTAVGPGEWWPAAFCVSAGLWQFDILLDRVPGRPATDFGIHWVDRRTRYLTRACFPDPVA
jgi:hypothetical protein